MVCLQFTWKDAGSANGPGGGPQSAAQGGTARKYWQQKGVNRFLIVELPRAQVGGRCPYMHVCILVLYVYFGTHIYRAKYCT